MCGFASIVQKFWVLKYICFSRKSIEGVSLFFFFSKAGEKLGENAYFFF